MEVKETLINRLTSYFGEDVSDYAIYEADDCFYVYPKAYGEIVMQEEPQYYSLVIMNYSGKILKDRHGIFGKVEFSNVRSIR